MSSTAISTISTAGARGGVRTWEQLDRRIIGCERCPRLRQHCQEVARIRRRAFAEWQYWGRPLPNFGDPGARLLVVGLAPAAHGGNRTGRMFTGDRSGDWLYRALHKAGFANQPRSEHREDDLRLMDCAITAVCHCAPPSNKPTPQEIANCGEWLTRTFDLMPIAVVVALGGIAWRAVVDEARRRHWLQGPRPRFGHGKRVRLADHRWLLGSYHPSQQNTFTGRLTREMLDRVFRTARRLLSVSPESTPASVPASAGRV
jgi:uracil-DNA glycosylase